MKKTYLLDGLHCASCVSRIKKAFAALPEIQSSVITIERAEIESNAEIPLERLQVAIESVGMYSIRQN